MIDGLKDRHRAAIIAAIAANPRVERAVLFGSRAMGTYTADSDVDIALFGDGLTLTDQARLGAAIDDIPMAQSVDLILYRFIDNSALLDHIRAHGVVWHRRRDCEKTARLHLLPRHRRTLESLLRKHLPDVEVWAYGSRVNERSHDGSNLDLVLRSPGLVKIDPSQLAELNEAVQESTVPFLVEARDWARLPESLQREIEREHVVLVKKEVQVMKGGCGWHSVTIGEFAPFSYGKGLRRDIRNPTGHIPVFGSNGHVDWHDKALTDGPTVIIGRKGTVGAIHYSPVPCWPIDTTFFISGDNAELMRFKYYALDTLGLGAMNTDSAVPGLNRDASHARKLRVPPFPEQRAIAHILGTLDDKIELNRRMNETLEAMARALFKSWFIDFDPVRAKAALRRHREATHANPLPLREGAGGGEVPAPSTGRSMREGVPPPRPSPSRGEGEEADQALRWEAIRRGYSPRTIKHAKILRQNQTDAEGLLWHYLRNKQLGGHKFRRQQPIGPYIADFACLSRKLLIELDGSQHAERKAHDEERDAFLRQAGYRILRFWNNEVFENCFGVLESIYAALHPHPSFAAESQPPHSRPFESELPPPPQSLSLEEQPPPQFPPLLRGRVRVGGDPSPKDSRLSTLPQGEGDWSVERARAYLDTMDPEIAALFPDRFVDSELGEIPEGWEVKLLGELIELAYGKALKAGDRKRGPIPVYGSNGQVGWHDKKLVSGPGIVVGRKGNPGIVTWTHGDFIPIDTTFYVVPRNTDEDMFFLFFALTAQNLPSVAADSAVPGLNRNLAYMNKQLVPDKQGIDEFNRHVSEIFTSRYRLDVESCTLAALRDTLLPKLISGELRVSDMVPLGEAERMI